MNDAGDHEHADDCGGGHDGDHDDGHDFDVGDDDYDHDDDYANALHLFLPYSLLSCHWIL